MSRCYKSFLLIIVLAVILSSCSNPSVNISNDQNGGSNSISNSTFDSERISEVYMDSSIMSDGLNSSEIIIGSQDVTSTTTGLSIHASSLESSSVTSNSTSSVISLSESNVSDPGVTDKPLNSFEAMYERALKSQGNPDRILKAMRKAKNGQPVSIVAFGGSITERYAASTQEKCYASIVSEWWSKNFPNSEIRLYNAGIGSSSTQMAAHRIIDDVLPCDPDLVIIDFAVNDANGQEYSEYFESTIRKILVSGNNPGIILLFFCMSDGMSTQAQQMSIGSRYDLPMISWKDAVYPLIQLGIWEWSKVSPDIVHPNDLGHQLAADLVGKYLDDVKSTLVSFDDKVDTSIPSPITPSRFEDSFKVQNTNINNFSATAKLVSLGGFSESSDTFGKMAYSWVAKNTDAPLIFEVTGRSVILLYRSNDPDGGVASVKVNGELKGNMDAGYPWDFGSFVIAPYDSDSVATYTIEIQMTDDPSSGGTGKNGDHCNMQLYQIMVDPS